MTTEIPSARELSKYKKQAVIPQGFYEPLEVAQEFFFIEYSVNQDILHIPDNQA
jgi:hypothetical protein